MAGSMLDQLAALGRVQILKIDRNNDPMPLPSSQSPAEVRLSEMSGIPGESIVEEQPKCEKRVCLTGSILSNQGVYALSKGEMSILEVSEVADSNPGYVHGIPFSFVCRLTLQKLLNRPNPSGFQVLLRSRKNSNP